MDYLDRHDRVAVAAWRQARALWQHSCPDIKVTEIDARYAAHECYQRGMTLSQWTNATLDLLAASDLPIRPISYRAA
jgi:hypothetical protein